MNLNPKQLKFCELYVQTGNATQSYLSAGYKAKDFTTAQANSSRLLLNDMVCVHIKQIQSKLSEDVKIDTQRIINKLAEIAFGDVSDIVEVSDGMIKLKEGADLSRLEAVSTSVSNSAETISIKFQDKLKALDMLCKILGVYERHEQDSSSIISKNAQRVLDTLRKHREGSI